MIHIDGMTIGHGKKILYDNVSFDIHAGDCIMLCGANGSGKTTLMKAIAALQETDCRVTMIPSRIPKVKGFTVKEFVKVSCYRQTDMSGKLSEQDENALENGLDRLGIVHLKDRDISTLSDGEFQKACIATSLVQNAGVILLDEPTAFLDMPNRYELCNLLRRLAHDEGKCILFSTHELDIAVSLCDSIALIAPPQLHILPTPEMVTSGHIERLFTGGIVNFDPTTRSVSVK